jgi:sporulation protein YlmC with PRC-barrel domain
MNTRQLFGREVLDVNAKLIGKVWDIEFDKRQGVIDYLIVKAGIVKQYEVSFEKIAAIGEKIILNIDEDQLKRKSVILM